MLSLNNRSVQISVFSCNGGTHFRCRTILNNLEMIAIMRSYIIRWRFCSLSSPSSLQKLSNDSRERKEKKVHLSVWSFLRWSTNWGHCKLNSTIIANQVKYWLERKSNQVNAGHLMPFLLRQRQRNVPRCKTHTRVVHGHCFCSINLSFCYVLVDNVPRSFNIFLEIQELNSPIILIDDKSSLTFEKYEPPDSL